MAQPLTERKGSVRPSREPLTMEKGFTRGVDSLEKDQSDVRQRQRRESEEKQGNLTELAVPHLTALRYRSSERNEFEERQPRQDKGYGQAEYTGAFLSEVAAPTPVDNNTHNGLWDPKQDAHSQSPSLAPRENKQQKDPSQVSATATHIYTISYLVLFSILGTLARLGVEAITRYPQAPFPSVVLWANVGGSLLMGFLAEDRRLFRQEWGMGSKDWSFHDLSTSAISSDADVIRRVHATHSKVKKTIPLFVGLATGFCGSFTSFSSFMRDAFLALTNDLASPSTTSPFNTAPHPAPRNGGFSFQATLAILIIQVACSISAFYFGAHVALLADPITPTLPFTLIRRILDPVAVFLGWGCWLGALILSILPPENFWRGRATLALVFAPPGCLLRFYASKYFNARIPSFPLGTFFVNLFGTGVLGLCYDLQHAPSIAAAPHGTAAACQVLQGLMEGFCGCTTTVSTWVAELTSLRQRHAYIYGTTSTAVALALLVVVMGSVGWTSGFGTPVCTV